MKTIKRRLDGARGALAPIQIWRERRKEQVKEINILHDAYMRLYELIERTEQREAMHKLGMALEEIDYMLDIRS